MNWRSYLRGRTHSPAFLWRMVIGIILAGVAVGFVAQFVYTLGPEVSGFGMTEGERQRTVQLGEEGQWGDVWWRMRAIYGGFSHTGPVALATIACCCWFVFLVQAMQIRGLRDWRPWCGLAAVGLGILSIWPTGFLIIWQEVQWDLLESNELAGGLRFFILGVGLREEAAKLLCLLPLIPILLWRRDELTALLISACVGLGFAMEENVGYFVATGGTATMGRFLTANPLHMAMTGLIGLAVYRGLRWPRDWGPRALAMFALMVLAHGVYDALIVVPALAEFSIGSAIIFALVMFQFFRELRTLRRTSRETISLSATFLFGVSTVTAVTFVYLSAVSGCTVAFNELAGGVIGLAVMVYLFLREMPETMVTV